MKHSVLPRLLVYQTGGNFAFIEYLREYGFEVIECVTEDVISRIKDKGYDMCILDHFEHIKPGDLRLLDYVKKVNERVPVIIMSNLHRSEYAIDAFNRGADDYIAKPFNVEEAVCRIKAVLRRSGIGTRLIKEVYQIGDYIFDTAIDTLKCDSGEIKLTNIESKVLAYLCAYVNELLPKSILLNNIWQNDNYYTKRSLDVHIHRLRAYFENEPDVTIETVRRSGYSLKTDKLKEL